MKRRFILTLVSGDAQSGSWAGVGSGLRKEISEHLGDVTFETFAWSGADSHDERLSAGKKLGARLEVQAATDPAAHRVVIAPGHNGNVAMYAARNLADISTMPDVVCAATPAFRFMPNKQAAWAIRILQYFSLAVPLVFAVLLMVQLVAARLSGDET